MMKYRKIDRRGERERERDRERRGEREKGLEIVQSYFLFRTRNMYDYFTMRSSAVNQIELLCLLSLIDKQPIIDPSTGRFWGR